MITVQSVYDFLDSFAPFSTALDFDNSGLLVGDSGKAVQTVAVCLDITADTVQSAMDAGADLMVSHHPVIFKPRRSIRTDDPVSMLLCAGMSAICAHTNLDAAPGGVNDVLAEIFSLERVEAVTTDAIPTPMVRVGFLPQTMRPIELAATAAELLDTKVRWCDGGRSVETVAVCGGSGGDLVADISRMGVDALITGDAGYHDFLDAEQRGVTLIAAGHFETENPVVRVLAQKLRAAFPEADVAVIDQKRTIKTI